jgi:hypothetical protein
MQYVQLASQSEKPLACDLQLPGSPYRSALHATMPHNKGMGERCVAKLIEHSCIPRLFVSVHVDMMYSVETPFCSQAVRALA